jgi:hypothetical protein
MAKTAFIYETLNDVKKMTVNKTDDGLMSLSGTFGVCGVRNNNNRVYETSNYAKMVDEMKERIKSEGGIPGELEHPQFMNITLENISHKITDINIDENGVVTGSIVLLNTPKGQIAQAIVEGGLPLFISSRATGAVNPKTGAVTLEKISTYDLVGSPGFSQAKLHLNENQVAESINESQVYYITEKEQENNTDNMELEQIQERLKEFEDKVNLLEEENKKLRESAPDMKELTESIQQWIVNEYTPKVEQWIVEEYTEDIKQNIIDESVASAEENFINETAPRIQNWIVNDFSPMIQQWIVEHYTPEMHNWCVEEFAQGLQNWITEEFTPELDKWANNDLAESIKASMENKINEAIDNSKKNSLDAIASTVTLLESLESQGSQKPTYTRRIDEGGAQEPKFIAEMPETSRVKWNMATPQVKESVMRRARLYNFNQEGAVAKFWESIDLDAIQPAQSIYEGLESIQDERERKIRAAFRAHRRF